MKLGIRRNRKEQVADSEGLPQTSRIARRKVIDSCTKMSEMGYLHLRSKVFRNSFYCFKFESRGACIPTLDLFLFLYSSTAVRSPNTRRAVGLK